MEFARNQMAEKLNHDPVLCEKLIPKWELGCRRVTPGPGYLEAFTKDNCTLTNSPITEITPSGVRTADGTEFECDVIICATGTHDPVVDLPPSTNSNAQASTSPIVLATR
jgi:cation diffusion facilitator CzcD-associated flavoprotein CzcO